MVSLMTISWDLGSADCVLMGGSRASLNHDVAGMQLITYFGGLSFCLLHARTLRRATVFLLLALLLSFLSALSVLASMVASPFQFPSITPIQNVEFPATRAWLQDMRLQTYAALDWATVAVHPQSLNILQ